jgi:hypothetical protein
VKRLSRFLAHVLGVDREVKNLQARLAGKEMDFDAGFSAGYKFAIDHITRAALEQGVVLRIHEPEANATENGKEPAN